VTLANEGMAGDVTVEARPERYGVGANTEVRLDEGDGRVFEASIRTLRQGVYKTLSAEGLKRSVNSNSGEYDVV
jgi:hypothetical protein